MAFQLFQDPDGRKFWLDLEQVEAVRDIARPQTVPPPGQTVPPPGIAYVYMNGVQHVLQYSGTIEETFASLNLPDKPRAATPPAAAEASTDHKNAPHAGAQHGKK